jgi:hypothetical protein
VWWLGAAICAWGGEAEAERYRLQTELEALAEKNAWSGVERTYVALEALGLPLTIDDLTLGALAARNEGSMLTALERLQKAAQRAPAVAGDSTAYDQAKASIKDLEARYNYVHVVVFETGKNFPNLERPDMPFSPEDQRAIAWAQGRIAATRAFMGLLPVGVYRLGEQSFEVVPYTTNAPMLEIRSGTPAASGTARSGP